MRELSPEATEGVKIYMITPSTTFGGPPPSEREAVCAVQGAFTNAPTLTSKMNLIPHGKDDLF